MPITINANIELKGGLRADLPSSGLHNEPFFCEDTGELFVWNGTTMKQIGAAGGGSFVPTSTTVNGHALTGNIVVSASDITTGTLPHAQLPSLVSGDIPNNAANTSGTAANLSGTPTLPNGTTATTQASSDASGKLATTQFVANALAGGIQLVTTTLTAAQLIGSYTTPFQIIPPPGSGKIIILTFGSLSFTNGSQPFQQPVAFQPTLFYGNLGYIGNSGKLPSGFFNNSDQIGIFTLPSGSSAVDSKVNAVNQPIFLSAPVDAGPIAAISLGSSGGGGYAPGDTGTISDGNSDAAYSVDTVSNPNSYVLTAAGNASGGHTVYTGTFTGGAGNAFVGHSFTITGFVAHTSNNGTFNCTASTATQLTLSNASGVAETHAGSAKDNNTGGTVLTFHLTANGSSYTAGATDVGTLPDSGNGDGGFLVNVDQITPGNGSAKLTLAYYTVDF